MTKSILPFICLFILQSAVAQTSMRKLVMLPNVPKVNTVSYKIGERTLQIKISQYGETDDMVYINLHDDEITAVNAARKLLERDAGVLIKIENYKTRNIKFKLDGKYYTFDPNRIFSRVGIIQTLTMFGSLTTKAVDEVDKFASFILQLIPKKPSCIIALHNNTNGRFSITSYLPGNIREKDAKVLFVNPDEDPDDIFLTTDSVLYQLLAEDKYNTILQDNVNVKRDGSLSVYCGEKDIRYVNCETEHGHDIQYQQMIMLLASHIEDEKIIEAVTYNYKMVPTSAHYSPKAGIEIMFGEKKVGSVKTVTTDSSWATVGQLEVYKDFPLYTNMDFFLHVSSDKSPRFEVRIDPTREKELIDPFKTQVSIRAIR
jgi:Ni,Fe-hydrogenase maturation factor